jgi:hypothetical protein
LGVKSILISLSVLGIASCGSDPALMSEPTAPHQADLPQIIWQDTMTFKGHASGAAARLHYLVEVDKGEAIQVQVLSNAEKGNPIATRLTMRDAVAYTDQVKRGLLAAPPLASGFTQPGLNAGQFGLIDRFAFPEGKALLFTVTPVTTGDPRFLSVRAGIGDYTFIVSRQNKHARGANDACARRSGPIEARLLDCKSGDACIPRNDQRQEFFCEPDISICTVGDRLSCNAGRSGFICVPAAADEDTNACVGEVIRV